MFLARERSGCILCHLFPVIEGIYVEFQHPEDRLLIRVHHSGNNEALFHFTRRLTRLLFPVLLKMAEQRPEIQAQPSPEARKVLVEMKHDQALQEVKFTQQPGAVAAATRTRPGGDTPILVTTVQTSRDPEGFTTLSLRPDSGHAWDLRLSENLLHALIKLLGDQAGKAEWDLDLKIPHGFGVAPDPGARQLH